MLNSSIYSSHSLPCLRICSNILSLTYNYLIQTVRQFGKSILEHVSDTRGLACGLNFLCSSNSSLSAVLLGLKHAVKLVNFLSKVLLCLYFRFFSFHIHYLVCRSYHVPLLEWFFLLENKVTCPFNYWKDVNHEVFYHFCFLSFFSGLYSFMSYEPGPSGYCRTEVSDNTTFFLCPS